MLHRASSSSVSRSVTFVLIPTTHPLELMTSDVALLAVSISEEEPRRGKIATMLDRIYP